MPAPAHHIVATQPPEFGWFSAMTRTPMLARLTGQVIVQDGGESLRRSLMMPDFVPPRERADGPWGWQ